MSETLLSLYKLLIKILSDSSIENPELDARLIIKQRTLYEWADLITKPDSLISKEQAKQIQDDVQKRLNHMPLSRIYGEREFWGLKFKVTPDVLDPRPDTETIIEIAVKRFEGKNPETILDLGTGSGCILISLLHEFPEAHGIGIDISPAALAIAVENAKNNKCDNRTQFLQGSWAESITQKFDLIVANPPYIANPVIPTLSPEVRNHDPILALDGGADGLNPYREIFSSLKMILKAGGIALFEIGYDQEKSITRLVEESGFSLRGVHLDLAGRPRVVEISCGDK